jgi:hypothetical protein
MFKTSKRVFGNAPSTPKLSSVSLPNDNDPRIGAAKRASIPERKPMKTSIFGGVIPDRSMTPLPGSRKPQRESMIGAPPFRSRAVSLASGIADVPSKPAKVARESSSQHAAPRSSRPSGGGSSGFQQPAPCAVSRVPSNAYPMERTSSQLPISFGRQHIAPSQPPATHRSHNSRHHTNPNFGEPPSSNATVGHTPKYMKATIKEVPLKEEAVALSWPLVEFATRRHSRKPLLHFDVGFDPRIDDWNIRANRGGYSTPLAREELVLPVSTHCVLTKMVIHCRVLDQWPITIERDQGLRCVDVFRAIYDTYHKPLTSMELAALGDGYIERCRPAFEQRCKDSPGLPLFNQQRGMRRVDLLRGRRIFKGLTRTSESGAKWVLQFDEPQH